MKTKDTKDIKSVLKKVADQWKKVEDGAGKRVALDVISEIAELNGVAQKDALGEEEAKKRAGR